MAFPLQSTCLPGVDEFTQNDSSPIATPPQLAIIDWFFPGFSMVAGVIHKYTRIDLNLYIPLVLLVGMLVVCWNYASSYLWDQVQDYFMSTVDIRTDDEIYNILMAWVAAQRFSKGARRFIVNTSLASRSWYLWRYDDENEEDGEESGSSGDKKKKQKALNYTPSFGSHYFWYRGHLLLFRRISNREQNSNMLVSEREEISISCFGRNPWILKELLLEARDMYNKKDEQNTQIYRGTHRPPFREPGWQRCMSRASRPFSTVILNEKTKQELIDDVTDYLNPVTQRWYANRGIPYRRGYLLHGPPGTGKSSLSLALAGFFKMRIYIVSLNSGEANEENLGNLFAALPRRCVVLLEDIDTAGLTHTREKTDDKTDGDKKSKNDEEKNQRLSLSGLLNILDGVASQEGRVLIMTTNHVEKLDKALIRPGRVDMIVKFGLADEYMSAAIFRNIFAYLEGDDEPVADRSAGLSLEELKATQEKAAKDRADRDAEIETLAKAFAAKVPSHEFSPAELQGHLMKHKHQPQRAIDTVEEFVENTRRDRKEKELKEAEEKREAEKKKAEEEEKKNKEKASSDATGTETEAETEIKKRVEEEIRKTFEEEIRKKVEAEMKRVKKEGVEKEDKSSTHPTDGESKTALAEGETGTSSETSSTTPIEKPSKDSGYSTPSASET